MSGARAAGASRAMRGPITTTRTPRNTRNGWRPPPARLTCRAAVMRTTTGATRRAGAKWRSHPVAPRRRA
eukprot:9180333-Lingulodinium_polyedra.AAC.1